MIDFTDLRKELDVSIPLHASVSTLLNDIEEMFNGFKQREDIQTRLIGTLQTQNTQYLQMLGSTKAILKYYKENPSEVRNVVEELWGIYEKINIDKSGNVPLH